MAYRNLDEFLTRLELAGEVTYLPLDRDRADFPLVSQADTDKVHVYTDPDGARVVHNLFATHHRIEQALRVGSLNLIAERLEELLEIGKPGALGVMISRAMTMFSAIRTTTNRRAPNEFQKLSYEDWRKRLPVALSHIQSNPTQATLLTGGQSPRMSAVPIRLSETGITGEFWPSLEAGETVALVIGGDPAFMLAAHAPLPDLIHRSYFASWLRDKPLDMMRLPGLDIEIPSNAECVIAAAVTEQFGEDTALDIVSVWTKPSPIYPQLLRAERDHVRDAFVVIMLPVIKRFLPGVRSILLRDQFGILTVDPSDADRQTILRHLWAVPISDGIVYWVMLPEMDDIEGELEGLTAENVVEVLKLVSGDTYQWVLLDASRKSDKLLSRLPEADLEIEHLLGLIKDNWRRNCTV